MANLPKESDKVERKPRNLTLEQEEAEESQYRRPPPRLKAEADQKPSPKSKP